MFVRHQAFTEDGREMPNDGSYFPDELQQKSKEEKKYASSAFDRKGEVDDPAKQDSSDTDYDEEVDHDDDAEENVKIAQHVFTIDLVARYPDNQDELCLHWGMSRKKEGAWGSPD